MDPQEITTTCEGLLVKYFLLILAIMGSLTYGNHDRGSRCTPKYAQSQLLGQNID